MKILYVTYTHNKDVTFRTYRKYKEHFLRYLTSFKYLRIIGKRFSQTPCKRRCTNIAILYHVYQVHENVCNIIRITN